MEQTPNKRNKLVRNILITAAVCVLVGITMGVLNSYVWPGIIPRWALTGGVGAAAGITFVLLSYRKDK